MNELKGSISFFKVLSATVAVVPGLLVLKNNLPLPPTFLTPLASVLVEIFGCFVVAFAWLNKDNFKKTPLKKFNRVIVFAFFLFLLSLSAYGTLLSFTTIDSATWREKMFVPVFALSPVPEGSFQKYYDEYGPADLLILLGSHYKTEVIVTQATIYTAFCMTFTFLTTTFTSFWLKYEAMSLK